MAWPSILAAFNRYTVYKLKLDDLLFADQPGSSIGDMDALSTPMGFINSTPLPPPRPVAIIVLNLDKKFSMSKMNVKRMTGFS